MKRYHTILAVLALLVSVALGLSVLITPAPRNAPATEFSAYRAAQDIQQISKEIHTVNDTAALADVRQYLQTTLQGIGLETELYTYQMVVNIAGTLKGQSDKSLLLVAHYDSNPGLGVGEAPGSHGAADDGYGIAVILEILRAIKARGLQENTIRVLFTDAEEADMAGSENAAADAGYNAAQSVAVFNIESRGLQGPAILFETSKNNGGIFTFYAQNAVRPATWSLATDVYRIMPNTTDFTSFMDIGMQGLNFSNLYKVEQNHTPLDVYPNISLSTLQGYGEQLLPVISAFAAGHSPDSFVSGYDMSYFTLLNGVLVYYPAWLNYLLLALALAAWVVYLVLAHKNGTLRLKRLWFTPVLLVCALGAAAAGTLLAWLLALVFGLPFKLMNLVNVPLADWITAIGCVVLLVLLVGLMRSRLKKGTTYDELTASAILLLVVMAAIFTFALPGGAFLFSFGAIAASLVGIIRQRVAIAGLFSGFVAAWIAAPVVALLLVALTIGSLGIVLLFACFPLVLFAISIANETV